MDLQNPSLLFKLGETFFEWLPEDEPCDKFTATSVICNVVEMFFLVSLSHLLHLVLKRLGQPSIISQLLAGFFLGPTIVGRFNLLSKDLTQVTSFSSAARILFMFLIGLEIDISYLQRTFHFAAMISAGNMMLFVPLTIASGMFLHSLIHSSGNIAVFVILMFIFFVNTEASVVTPVLNELKITMTEIGKVAVSTALITNVVCLSILGLLDFTDAEHHKFKDNFMKRVYVGIAACLLLILTSVAIRMMAISANNGNKHKRAVEDDIVFYFLLLVFVASKFFLHLGYDPMMAAFVFGLAVPRGGLTAKTLMEQLPYVVQNLVLPVYFGVSALQVDFSFLKFKEAAITTLTVFVLGMIGKMSGTVIGAKCLGISMRDGLLLSFLLNVKGPVNLTIISLGKKYGMWSDRIHMALVISLFFNTLTACLATAYIVRQERKMNRNRFQSVETLNLESELRILACVHSPSDVPAMLVLIEMSSGIDNRLYLAPYILHLMEITSNSTNTVVSHLLQLQYKDYSNNAGGDQKAQQVNVAIDAFVEETNIHLRKLTAVSRFDTMHEDLEYAVQEVHASLAIVPFHCKQRFDGKMGVEKDEIRKFNVNVIRHAPCSVGILVDRGLGMGHKLDGIEDESSRLHVVVLFLGGPDDREAAAYAARLALQPCVNVTLMRFLPTIRQEVGVSVCTRNVANESSTALEIEEADADEIFMANFYNRFAVSGAITYVERLVKNSTELITTLSSTEGMYSLYVMGRRVQGPAQQLTDAMSQWEECPELGAIGDLLASSDFMLNGSVLVIQQHNATS